MSTDGAPIKRMIQIAKDESRAVDATHGRKTRAIIVTESNHLILSALLPETLTNRYQDLGVNVEKEEFL